MVVRKIFKFVNRYYLINFTKFFYQNIHIMKTYLLLLICVFFSFTLSAQTVYRVNNNPNLSNSSATPVNSYSTIDDAIAAASDGDIIYVEPSPSGYGDVTLSKSLTFIGNGYLLDGSNIVNANLQENINTSTFNRFRLQSGSEGSTFIGLNVDQFFFDDIPTNANITIEKCQIREDSFAIYSFGTKTFDNVTVKKSYFSSGATTRIFNDSDWILNNFTIENCIFNGKVEVNPSPSSTNLIYRNNVAPYISATGYYVANNIFTSTSTSSFNTCVIRNNVFVANQPGVTTGPLSTNGNNLINQTLTDIFVNTGSADGKFQLAAGSPAIGGGVDIGGTKPDCGAFGGNDPYKLSGIPDIPTIYELSLPNGNSVPAGTTTIDIDFSTRSNN